MFFVVIDFSGVCRKGRVRGKKKGKREERRRKREGEMGEGRGK